ncbi:ATP-dependent DNA helicase RecG [Microbacterium halophytorum]|uniref:ATP-dependent DNA helicase RecG n=1 Tax=Microbacterium halophytorum TaxID=2067568 RepID=UPI000CFDEA95|nr:ATP-dependent DNA helicase RecG [Microbacterium halophytorum]
MALTLDTPLAEALPEKRAASLKRSFGMATVGDLITHYPRRYQMRGELTPITGLTEGETVTIVAEVRHASTRRMRNRSGSLLEVSISDGRGEAKLTFFNQAWRQKDLTPGRRGMFSGKVGHFQQQVQLANPEYELFDDSGDADVDAAEWARTPIAIYPATAKDASWDIARAIRPVLDGLGDIGDPLSPELREREELLPYRRALELIHRPTALEDAEEAKHTLRMHEAIVLQLALAQQRRAVHEMPGTPRHSAPGGFLERFDAVLPFERTPDQVAVGAEIAADITADHPMNRLVQGEVGSGKTLVALRAMLQTAESGGQAALIAPTEVLAAQHLRSIAKMLGPELQAELMPTLLTGQMGAAERRRAALRVASGQALIVVGTHALLSDKTTFADLGLVVVDEQHRFGVEQREALRAKGRTPHMLVLTATPIPRTVAMTVFGDLDVSTIRTMPAGRAGIETFVAPLHDHPSWWFRVWQRAGEEVRKGHQVFAVCPAIDVDDATGRAVEEEPDAFADDAPEESARKGPKWGVLQLAAAISTHPDVQGLRLEILHGRMTSEEKDAAMRAFAGGDIDILVATTVIEVGVDVPNASTMIIVEADRFGVSQLHQLRGRVGRGEVLGLCLLVTDAEQGSPARERVDAVAATLDGFELAEKDVELRGEGDVLGATQSGLRSSLKLLRVVKDIALIGRAREVAERVILADPELVDHPGLAEALARRVGERERAAMSKA